MPINIFIEESATVSLEMLRAMKTREALFASDTYIIRDLLFTYGGQGLPYAQAIDHLITALTPAAITERLLK